MAVLPSVPTEPRSPPRFGRPRPPGVVQGVAVCMGMEKDFEESRRLWDLGIWGEVVDKRGYFSSNWNAEGGVFTVMVAVVLARAGSCGFGGSSSAKRVESAGHLQDGSGSRVGKHRPSARVLTAAPCQQH